MRFGAFGLVCDDSTEFREGCGVWGFGVFGNLNLAVELFKAETEALAGCGAAGFGVAGNPSIGLLTARAGKPKL